MSFGPLGRSKPKAKAPPPVDKSGVKVSPSPVTAPPAPGNEGTDASKPMSVLIPSALGPRREGVSHEEDDVDDAGQIKPSTGSERRVVGAEDRHQIAAEGGPTDQRTPRAATGDRACRSRGIGRQQDRLLMGRRGQTDLEALRRKAANGRDQDPHAGEHRGGLVVRE